MAASSGEAGPPPQVSSTTPGVNEIAGQGWTVLVSVEPMPYDVTGQYMYFAADRDLLLSIARQEIAAHGFHEARVSRHPSPQGYVLCLYTGEAGRKAELGERVVAMGGRLRYLYWKPGTVVPRIGEQSTSWTVPGVTP